MEGATMSHTWLKKNKHAPHEQRQFQQYLANINEPVYQVFDDTPKELEAELLENSENMRRKIRRTAKKLRYY